jgi:hypothetical protein
MATTYFIRYPRDFANEYTVYAVAPEDRERFGRLIPDAERITRYRAIEIGWTRPREAKRDGEQWFGGFAEPGHGLWAGNVAQALEACREGTREILDNIESEHE